MGLRFTASTKVAPKNDTLQTSSTRGTNTNSIDDDHDNNTDDNNKGVTFHNNKNNISKIINSSYFTLFIAIQSTQVSLKKTYFSLQF